MPDAHQVPDQPAEPDVLAYIEGRVGRIVLNRPRALNALTLDMVRTIASALGEWREAGLRAVLIESSSEKAFCAGGDIRAVRQHVVDGQPEAADDFFATEYDVNLALGSYSVPVVAVVDGMCMGGGLGLTVHGPYRVVTPRASFAMPETKIGFFPDVGGSHFLPRLPGAIGRYLGLTGARFSAGDALGCGVATHLVQPEMLAGLAALLSESDDPVDAVLRSLQSAAAVAELLDTSELRARRSQIDWAFGAPDLKQAVQRLEELAAGHKAEAGRWAQQTLEQLAGAAPSSLDLTELLMSWGREHDLRACLEAERYAARRAVAGHDFVEGVRSVLVDKDHNPSWTAEAPTLVTTDELDAAATPALTGGS
jgi:enoyl-CoA hydratase